MTTVRELWDSWAAKVIPPDAPEVQYTECRRAFYGGCWGMLTEVVRITDSVTDTPAGEAAGAAMLERLRRELEQFYRDVKAGKA